MEKVNLPKFDHSQKTIGSTMGLSEYDQHFARTAILFEVIKASLLVREIYDDPSEAPIDLTTVSGLLEKSMKRGQTLNQQLYICLEFHNGYLGTMDALQKMSEARERREKAQEQLKEEKTKKGSDVSKLKDIIQKIIQDIQFVPLESSVKTIRECNYDFEKFIKIILPKDSYAADGTHLHHPTKESGPTLPDGTSLGDIIKKALGDDIKYSFKDMTQDEDEDELRRLLGDDDDDDDDE